MLDVVTVLVVLVLVAVVLTVVMVAVTTAIVGSATLSESGSTGTPAASMFDAIDDEKLDVPLAIWLVVSWSCVAVSIGATTSKS
jgi:hypothetical protein